MYMISKRFDGKKSTIKSKNKEDHSFFLKLEVVEKVEIKSIHDSLI